MDFEKIIYDLVTFENVQISYRRDEKVVVEFHLDPEMKASTSDWIGVYPAGWSSFESFIAYEWGIGQPIKNSLRTRTIVFRPKDFTTVEPNRHYQFVYVSKNLEIMGVSQFFQFCTVGYDDLDLTRMPLNGIFNSTTLCPDTPQKVKQIDQAVNLGPTCKIDLSADFSKICTVCSKCKQLFELIDLQAELQEKVEVYQKKNDELQSRIVNLEASLENLKLSNAPGRDWNDEIETKRFQNFVEDLCHSTSNSVDCKGDSNCVFKNTFIDSLPEFYLDEFNNREIILKAIIGHQEVKIRELTKVICRSHVIDHEVYHALPALVEGVVSVSRTEEQLLPEECILDQNGPKNSDKED